MNLAQKNGIKVVHIDCSNWGGDQSRAQEAERNGAEHEYPSALELVSMPLTTLAPWHGWSPYDLECCLRVHLFRNSGHQTPASAAQDRYRLIEQTLALL